MLEIFASNRPSFAPLAFREAPLIPRKILPLPASGATILFSDTFYPKEEASPPSPALSTMAAFWQTLWIKQIPYCPAPETSPWARPRLLQVPKLPDPAFSIPPPRSHFAPESGQTADLPLIPDMKENDPRPVANGNAIVAYAQTALPQKGMLRQDKDGSVYLEVSPKYHREILPLLHEDGIDPGPLKIAVVLAEEWQEKQGWGEIKEIGKTFSFTLSGLYCLKPLFWPQTEQVWFFSLHCPALQQLRQKHLLAGMRPLYLTLASRKEKRRRPEEKKLFRINVSCYAA